MVAYYRSYRRTFDWTVGLPALLISWVVLSVAFGIRYLALGWFDLFSWTAVAVGLGFVLHELAHRETAKAYGCFAEFKLWPMGLALALFLAVITRGTFVFAAPGAVVFSCLARGYRRFNPIVYRIPLLPEAAIAAAGPLANVVIGLIFQLLYYVTLYPPFYLISSVNWFLALFNLLPLEPLDGAKVFRYNQALWLALFSISAVFAFLVM